MSKKIMSQILFKCEIGIVLTLDELKLVSSHNIRNPYGLTPLMVAIIGNNYNIVKSICDVCDIEQINQLDDNGNNALIWAFIYDRKDIIKLLISLGISYHNSMLNHLNKKTPYTDSNEYKLFEKYLIEKYLSFKSLTAKCVICKKNIGKKSIGEHYCSLECCTYFNYGHLSEEYNYDLYHNYILDDAKKQLHKDMYTKDIMMSYVCKDKDVANLINSYIDYRVDDIYYSDHIYDEDNLPSDTECDYHYGRCTCLGGEGE